MQISTDCICVHGSIDKDMITNEVVWIVSDKDVLCNMILCYLCDIVLCDIAERSKGSRSSLQS